MSKYSYLLPVRRCLFEGSKLGSTILFYGSIHTPIIMWDRPVYIFCGTKNKNSGSGHNLGSRNRACAGVRTKMSVEEHLNTRVNWERWEMHHIIRDWYHTTIHHIKIIWRRHLDGSQYLRVAPAKAWWSTLKPSICGWVLETPKYPTIWANAAGFNRLMQAYNIIVEPYGYLK